MSDLFAGATRQRIRARPVEGQVQVDFTGGLRLVDEGERIELNQLRELTNMDPLPSGGIERRSGIMPFATFPEAIESTVLEYETAAGVELIALGSASERLYRVLPGNQVIDTGIGFAGSGGLHGIQIGQYLYMGRDSIDTNWRRWDGTTLTATGTTLRTDAEDFNGTGLPDFGSFLKGGIPESRTLQVWDGRTWAGSTRIGGEENKSAVSFSFSFGQGDIEGQEDFYENWAYYLDSQGHDEIEAMIPLAGHMYVFMHNSIHRFTPYQGTRADLFYSLDQFESRVGIAGYRAVVTSSDAIWFYDREEGLMRIGADGTLSSHMAQIEDLKDNLIADTTHIALGFWDDKVYVSVPEGVGATGNTKTYVYHTRLDAWSMYDIGFRDFIRYRPTVLGQPRGTFLGVMSDPVAALVDLGHDNDHSHDHFSDVSSTEILGSAKTAWFDSEVPEAVKDWRALETVYRAKVNQVIQTTAMIDWNPHQIGGRWTEDVSNSFSWDDGNLGPAAWVAVGTGVVEPTYAFNAPPVYPGYQENNVNELAVLKDREARRDETSGPNITGTATKIPKPVRTSKVCSSRAMSLEFSEAASSGRWGVDRITIFYSLKPIGI